MAVLDTSFLIDLARGRDAAQAALHTLVEEEAPLIVPAQAAIEYLVGLADPVAGLHDLQASYHVVGVDEDLIREAARLGRQAQAEGRFPGWADLQVGASSVLEGQVILTADPAPFRGFGCEVWAYRDQPRHPGADG